MCIPQTFSIVVEKYQGITVWLMGSNVRRGDAATMPQRITRTRTYSHRTLFGGRVTTRVTSAQTYFNPRPQPQVHLTGAELMQMQRMQAEQRAAAREQDQAQQQAHMDAIVQAPRGFSPLACARWLHTVPGAATTLGVFALALILAFAFDWPYLIIGETIALAIVDWQNLRTMHGAIGWRQWAVSRRGLAWFVGFLLVCYGWLFLPAVYAIQAWGQASEIAERVRTERQARIAALEAEVFADRIVPPPPPPVVPLATDTPNERPSSSAR